MPITSSNGDSHSVHRIAFIVTSSLSVVRTGYRELGMICFQGLRTLFAALVLSLAACSDTEKAPAITEAEIAIELSVMTFNIEWGGANISFDNVVEAIRRADAEIVGIQEAEGNLQRLAAELAWHYDLQNYVISKYPLIDPPGADGRFVYVEVKPGKVVAIANVHLPSDPYGPDAVRDGATAEAVIEMERVTRLPKIEPYLAALAPLIGRDIPLFVTGDFNSPAHTDWSAEAVATRPYLRYPLNWPVSKAMVVAGFKDSWREVYVDPVAHSGLTWWAARPPLETYTPGENDAQDRIDFLWYAGPVNVRSSELVGEEGGPGVSISVMPWPSDHRAVVSRFTVFTAALPELVSTGRRVYRTGEDVEVIYRSAQADAVDVMIKSVEEAGRFISERKASGTGRLQFAADLFTAGQYRVVMRGEDENRLLKKDFWILARNAAPTVEVTGSSFNSGDPIEISWRNAPGNRNDYVAVFRAEAGAAFDSELPWTYVNALPAGQLRLDATSSESGWPLEPGTYVIRLLKDDGYEQLAESLIFTIK
jgi:endonuclease/exonuclease/phosphatase family metal-dependent hydrolase